jgi:hypothetical protein
LDEVAYTGTLVVGTDPTATNRPDEFTVTDLIIAEALLPFICAGVVQVDPLEEVAYKG